MKLKNIAINDKIQAKSSLEGLKEGEVVKVISKEDKYYSGDLTILVERDDGCTSWECHKDFRKPRVVIDNLKQIDQSAFDGLDKKWRFASICSDGELMVWAEKPKLRPHASWWCRTDGIGIVDYKILEHCGYDTSNWKDSLIERESVELTGSDLCRAMLERGDENVMCLVGDSHEDNAMANGVVRIITELYGDRFRTASTFWRVAIPVNSQRKPLTAAEVGIGESL